MPRFLGGKIAAILGRPPGPCPLVGPGNGIVVPRSAPCTSEAAFGAQRVVTLADGTPAVRVAAVAALTSDFLDPTLLTGQLRTLLNENNLIAYNGLAIGYVLTFSNGLKVYLSGDTGATTDMYTIVRGFYQANLAVVAIAGTEQMGPDEAAFAIRELVQPEAVIPWHTLEVSTTGGQVNPDTRLARFIGLMDKIPVHVPLSSVTMEFDGHANCAAGCGSK